MEFINEYYFCSNLNLQLFKVYTDKDNEEIMKKC